jgi:hypothetical protein
MWLGKWVLAEVVGTRALNLVVVRVPSPIPGAPAQEVPLPRHWTRLPAGATPRAAATQPAVAAASASRTWTDSSGKFKIEAKFISLAGGQVTLEKPDGVQIRMPLDKLSAADQSYVTEQASRP